VLRLRFVLAFLCLFFGQPANPQTVGTGAVSGQVAGEDGRALRAVVWLQSPIAGKGFQRPTGLDGSFGFEQVPPGRYTLCLGVPAAQAQSAGRPFLDACAWGTPPASVQVAAGSSVSGVRLTAVSGVAVVVQLNDPEGALPVAGDLVPFGPQLQVVFRAADRMVNFPRLASKNALGSTYTITLPADTPLTLAVTLPHGKVLDASGNAVQGEIPVQVPKGATPAPIVLTVHKN